MAKQRKLPAMQFYTGDWMKDTNLRGVPLAAKGLWIEMLCLMHESDRRGYLQSNGKPVPQDQLARMTGCSSDEVSQCLEVLEISGVFSRTKNGIIYSRRMVRDEEVRQKSIINGRLGGNPSLKRSEKGVNPWDKGGDNPKRGSSSSSSTSVNNNNSGVGQGEIPKKILDYAIGVLLWLTPDVPLKSLLMDYPEDWIESAMKKLSTMDRGKRNPTYLRGMLQGYQKNGGPPNDDSPQGTTGPNRRQGSAKNRELAKRYSG